MATWYFVLEPNTPNEQPAILETAAGAPNFNDATGTFNAPTFTCTTVNGVAITTGTGTLTLANGKTLTVNKTMTLTGADDTSVATLPAGAKTLAANDGSNFSLTTQLINDLVGSSILPATDGFVWWALVQNNGTLALTNVTGTTSALYSFSAQGTGLTIDYTGSAGAVTAASVHAGGGGSNWKVGDLFTVLPEAAGSSPAVLRVLTISGSAAATVEILAGGTLYPSGAQSAAATVVANANFTTLTIAGALTANITVITPYGVSKEWNVVNNTTGAYTITVKTSNNSDTAIGTGVVVAQGSSNSNIHSVFSDGATDVWPVATSYAKDTLYVNNKKVSAVEIITVPAISASSTTDAVWIADDNYKIVSVSEIHRVASTSGTLQVEVLTGTTAPGSGTVQLGGTSSLSGTANTVLTPALIGSPTTIASGNRVGLVFGGTMTNLAGCVVTIVVQRV